MGLHASITRNSLLTFTLKIIRKIRQAPNPASRILFITEELPLCNRPACGNGEGQLHFHVVHGLTNTDPRTTRRVFLFDVSLHHLTR